MTLVAADFITSLPPTADGFDTLMTLTCKSSKRVLLLAGKGTWTAPQWAHTWLVALQERDWSIPIGFVSDMDKWFLSDFFKRVFELLGTEMFTSTAYHPQTDGQSERTNQTANTALRYFTTSHPDLQWTDALPALQHYLNSSKNAMKPTLSAGSRRLALTQNTLHDAQTSKGNLQGEIDSSRLTLDRANKELIEAELALTQNTLHDAQRRKTACKEKSFLKTYAWLCQQGTWIAKGGACSNSKHPPRHSKLERRIARGNRFVENYAWAMLPAASHRKWNLHLASGTLQGTSKTLSPPSPKLVLVSYSLEK